MQWISWIADILSIVAGISAFFGWMQTRRLRSDIEKEKLRQDEIVHIVLQYESRKVELPGPMRRAELTRAEVQGRLGMIPLKKPHKPSDRYSITYLNTPEFMTQLDKIREGSGEATLVIKCTRKELAQFDL